MRLAQLHIDGFGTFSNYSITDLKPGINILFGGNEAGKSTLLQFIRFTLFGYPRPLEQRFAPVHGGNHGGRIKALLADGTDVILERTAGFPGATQLHAGGTVSENAHDWFRLLGNASGSLFENVFAICLDELIGLESLNRSGVEDKIFSVGLGLKNISIKDVEQSLVSQMEAVYKPRGSKQRAILLLREMETHNREIEAVQRHLPQYQQLSRNMDRHLQSLKKVEAELSRQQSRYATLSNFAKCYQSFVIIRDVDRELPALPAWREYPENGLTRLEHMEAEEARLQQTLADLRADLTAAQADKTTGYNEALIARGQDIEKLSLNFEKYKTCLAECREDHQALDDLSQSIRRQIAAVNDGWTEDDILSFTDMITHRDRLDTFQRRLEVLQNKQDKLDTEINLLKARRSSFNARSLCLLVGQALVVGAAPLIVFRNYLWGLVLLFMGAVLIAGRKTLNMEDPLKEAIQASGWMEAEKALALKEYQRYLTEELGLSPELSPDAARTALQHIEQISRDIAARDKHQRRGMEKEKFIRAFETELDGLSPILTADTVQSDKTLLAVRIFREHKEALSLKNRAIQKNNTMEQIRQGVKKAGQALSRLAEEIDRLLASIQATDRDNFRKKYRDNSRVTGLIEQRRQAQRTIEQIVGIHDSEKVIAYLTEKEKPALEKELGLAETRLKTLREERDDLNRKISADTTLREQLRTSSALAEVMTKKATCRENLNRCHREWLAAGIAHHVLQQVKSQYEQKKQPAIIQHSSDFFRRITGGRYRRIRVSLEDGKVLVFDASSAAKRIDQLSRGTREQLLISIRLGFIEEYEKRTESLPLILDDILVNFDRDRATRTAAILHDFSANRQTLLFTCHPGTRDLFQDLPVNHLII